MGMGITKLISWECEWEYGWLDGNGRELNSTFSHVQSEEEKQPVSGATSAFPGTSLELRRTVIHWTVIVHQLRSAVSLTLRISAAQTTITSKAAMNWQNMSI